MTEQATQTADELEAEPAPEAVDAMMEHPEDALQPAPEGEETMDENSLMGAEQLPQAPEKSAIHSEQVEDAAVDAADIAQVMETPEAQQAAQDQIRSGSVTRNRGMRWYIIHAYTGFEKKVAQAILEEAAQKGLSDKFEEVTVPSEEVMEMRRGKKVKAERNMFPGYVMAKMEMTDATWQLVRTTDKVAGFLGGRGQRPQPISEAEANAIFDQVQEGGEATKRTVIYDIGEQVKIIDGPFDSFIGTVEDIDEEKEKLKVSVSIFGRPTPVELSFDQVEKS